MTFFLKIYQWSANRKWDFYFFFLAGVNIVAFFPFFQLRNFFFHDALMTFTTYHFFYSELFFQGELPQWSPFYAFGMPSHYVQIASFTPLSYLTMALGYCLRVKNVYFLYGLTMLLEQLVFLAGLYHLSKMFFHEKMTVMVVCLIGILTHVSYGQIFFNFRIYYLAPLILYAIFSFFQKKHAAYLWIAGILVLLNLLGAPQYFASIFFFVYFFVFFMLLLSHIKKLPLKTILTKKSIVLLVLLAFLLICHFVFLKHLTYGVSLASESRNAETLGNSQQDFITYGGVAHLPSLVTSLVSAYPFFQPNGAGIDNTFYVSVAGVFFFFWALIFVRKYNYFVLMTVFVSLVFLSLGGAFSKLVYYFPLMAYFRHIGLIYGLAKIFMILCLGFGLDHFLMTKQTFGKKLLRSVFVCAGILLCFFLLKMFQDAKWIEWLCSQFQWCSLPLFHLVFRWGGYAFFLLIVGGVEIVLSALRQGDKYAVRFRIFRALFVLALMTELFSYQSLALKSLPDVDAAKYQLSSMIKVKPLKYQPQRFFMPKDEAVKLRYDFLTRPERINLSTFEFDYMQFDPCIIRGIYDLMCSGVKDLFKINSGILAAEGGCEEDKLRIVTQSINYETKPEAKEFFVKMGRVLDVTALKEPKMPIAAIYKMAKVMHDKVIFVNGNAEEMKKVREGLSGFGPENVSVKVKKFTANTLIAEANVKKKGGAWMVYDDAYHPGWKAYVDGQKVDISQANLAFKAVYLSEGSSEIVLKFFNGKGSVLSIFFSIWGAVCGGLFILFVARSARKDFYLKCTQE